MRADISEPEQKLKNVRSSLWAAFINQFKNPSGEVFGYQLTGQLWYQIRSQLATQIEIEVEGW